MTLQQMLQWGAGWLKEREVPEADLNAWYLLADCFQMERSGYFLHQEEEADAGKEKKFRQMIEKRGQRIPLEYILGYTEFMGFKFEVDSHVLIPRQDTECLVEQVLPFCPGKKVLDLCTGSGCIGISLAVLGGPAAVVLADVSEEALKVAEKNAENHGVKPVFCQGDLFENVPADLFDVIVSNPPYIASEEIQKLMPEVQDHEPVLALDGREDGLYFYRKIIELSPSHLADQGMLAFEIGYDQGESVAELMRKKGFQQVEVKKDLAGLDRIVTGHICHNGG